MTIAKQDLSLAGEFAVASELCRRGIYAQLTLGLRKRTDLLVETETAMLRIQVKAKQAKYWVLCKGIFGKNIILVFVDYQNKRVDERPDFYVLTPRDWENFVKSGWVSEKISEGKYKLDNENCPVHINKEGEPTKGVGVEPEDISEHKEKWGKIKALLDKEG